MCPKMCDGKQMGTVQRYGGIHRRRQVKYWYVVIQYHTESGRRTDELSLKERTPMPSPSTDLV